MSASAPRTRKRSLHIAHETTFATDPSADGSGYLYTPAEGIEYTDQLEVLTTEYSTGRNYPTESEIGADGAEITFRTPLIGMASAAGDGTDASSVTDDWLDLLFEHSLGVQATSAGEGVGAGSTTTNLVLDTDAYGPQDLVPIYQAAIPAGNPRTQWTAITVDPADGTYTVAPAFTTAPETAAIAYGVKRYTDDDDGGPSLAAVVRDDTLHYTLLGGRVSRLRIIAEAQRRVMCEFSASFDRKSEDTAAKTALPAATRMATTPIKSFRSPVWFNGSRISTRMIEIDFALTTAAITDTESTNGRAGWDLISIAPMVTIEPLRSDDYINLKRAGTKGPLMIQLGAGVLAGGVLNTVGLHMARAEAREVTITDENGRARNRIVFHAVDQIEFSAGVGSRFFQICRA